VYASCWMRRGSFIWPTLSVSDGLVLRHQHHGHNHRAARERTFGNDERNAQLVNAAQNQPDLWIEQEFEPNTR